ncbi:MAG: adenylate/guanylate cyclase domain-containing protein [Chloroflexota bacterium]|nr:adenylate/guanylate cyclase domain-containing protein [Chloroflexota bacterium]
MRLLRRVTLLQFFSLISLISVLLISILLGLLVSDAIQTSSITTARDTLADVVRAHVLVRDPSQEPAVAANVVTSSAPLMAPALLMRQPSDLSRLHPYSDLTDWESWHQPVVAMFSGLPIYLVKIWSPDHRIVWSDRANLIGESHPENPQLTVALTGQLQAEVSLLGKAENEEQRQAQASLMEVYVPIVERGTFRVVGVFEVYQQVEDLVSQIQLAQSRAWTAIALSMGALYLILVGLFARASRTITRLGRLQELERYFSPAVARAIAAGEGTTNRNNPNRLLPQQGATLSRRLLTRGEISVLFTDIRGFTRQSEMMDAEDVVEMLNAYMEVVTTAVFRHHGSIDKFLGDGVLAVFGAPIPDPNHALDAVRAAGEIRQGLRALNLTRRATNQVPIIIGAAVTTGLAVTGNIGSEKQLSFTVTGDTVNLGSRLVGIAQAGEVLISARTYTLMQRDAATDTPTGPWSVAGPRVVAIRGREEPATIYSLDPPTTDGDEATGDGDEATAVAATATKPAFAG